MESEKINSQKLVNYKMSFQQRCTPEYTLEWVEKIKHYRLWIRKQIAI